MNLSKNLLCRLAGASYFLAKEFRANLWEVTGFSVRVARAGGLSPSTARPGTVTALLTLGQRVIMGGTIDIS